MKVLNYEPTTPSFVLSMETDREDEKLIIYRPDKESSFRLAIKREKKAMDAPLSGGYGSLKDGSLHRNDIVKIPYLKVDADTNFAGLLSGELHYTGNPLPWKVASAFQLTRFELFEEGAKVHVETGVVMEPFGDPPTPPTISSRSFICDQAFFVFMWRKGADWPYLATWVDGGDCLNPFPTT